MRIISDEFLRLVSQVNFLFSIEGRPTKRLSLFSHKNSYKEGVHFFKGPLTTMKKETAK